MLVWDPFVGTGSILVAAAHLGAQTIGTDINICVIKWGKHSSCLIFIDMDRHDQCCLAGPRQIM